MFKTSSARLVRPARARVDPYSRLLLDINAAHNADQAGPSEPAPPIDKSAAALRGESFRGDVRLPQELQNAVNDAIESLDKQVIRTKALELYAQLRKTSSVQPPPSSHRDRAAQNQLYDASTSIAYLVGLMPSVYAATVNVLHTARSRLGVFSDWEPERVIDFGSGTGSAAWAFEHIFGPTKRDGTPREYIGLEASQNMVEVSSLVLSRLAQKIGDAKLSAKAYQLPLPASREAMAKLHMAPSSSVPGKGKRTLAIAAFTLGDLGTREKRKELVRAMWNSGAEVMIVLDRGTPGGSRMVVEAREQLLMFGRRSLEEQELEGATSSLFPATGSFVVAPCPHDGACPLHHTTKTFCHFSQRVQSPSFLRDTKHSSSGTDDAAFSYVVVMRGSRPAPSASSSLDSIAADLSTALHTSVAVTSNVEDSSGGVQEPVAPGDEVQWPRLVAPPKKRSKHVILEVCALSGEIEHHTIPKSQGRQAYYDARKALWGDSFPHPPKNGPQPAPVQSMEPVQDKFGRDRSKVRSKKEWRDDRVDDARQGGRRRKKEPQDRGNFGIKEYELDLNLP